MPKMIGNRPYTGIIYTILQAITAYGWLGANCYYVPQASWPCTAVCHSVTQSAKVPVLQRGQLVALTIEGLREITKYIDIFLFSAHHSNVFCFRCSVYWWKRSVRF